ncbi:MAG: hypothetical protein JSW73_00395 [Candidatus Woesearchaeota archaeon]|nr:MAG: hypothetical protein JSW73_00395 [Candidatus Woesearchaeota archaeon]
MKIHLYETYSTAKQLGSDHIDRDPPFYCFAIPSKKDERHERLSLDELADKLLEHLPNVDNPITHPNVVTKPPKAYIKETELKYTESLEKAGAQNYKNLDGKALDKLCDLLVIKRARVLKQKKRERRNADKLAKKREF